MVHSAEQRKKERTQTNEVYVTEVNTNTTAAKTSGVHLNRTSIRQNYTPSPRPVWRATPCVFCSTNHATSDCPLSIAQKRAAIEKLGCCQNCLRKNHKVERCKSKFACYTCKRKHHSLICPEREKLDAIRGNNPQHSIKCPRPISRPHKNGKPQWPGPTQPKYQQTPIDTITINLSLVLDPDYKLPFLQLRTPSGALVNALIDSGATTSIMSKLAVQRLRCPIHQNKLVNFKGFLSSTGPQRINFHRLDILDNSGKVWNTIIPEFDHLPTTIKAPIFTTEDTSFLRQNNIDPKALMGLKRFDGKPIDMIIGNNILANILATSTRHILPSGRIVEETSLGYITHPSPVPDALRYAALPATQISDSVESSYVNHIDSDHPLTESDATAATITDSLLDKLLEQSWRLEVLGIEPPTIVKGKQLLNEELVTEFKQSAVLDPDNYIYVQFPFNGKEANLNDNYLVAVSRLVSLVNKQLERPTDRTSYNDIIQQQLSARFVLDASSHMKHEMSLNDCIHAGPSILKSILGILLRARTTPYLMIADIEKAFHQVRVQSHHRNVTKFLWLKNHIEPPTPDNIVTYRFTRLPFGITASPFLLAITILRYMELNPQEIHKKDRTKPVSHLLTEWEAIKQTFQEKSYTFPRQVAPAQGVIDTSLILFSDASKNHYAMSAYLRFEYQQSAVHTQLIYSRTRIKPSKSAHLTIPRMELLGVFIAANAASTLTSELSIRPSSVTFFCDNTAVLHWITHQPSVDKWVQNRPSFRHVPTDQNPADIASRGATLSQLRNNELWHHGPQFLKQEPSNWPQPLGDSPEEPRDFHCYVLNIDKPPFPEHKGILTTQPPQPYTSIVPYSRTNSLLKLVSITQKVMRFIHKLLKRRNTRYPNTPYLWISKLMKDFALSSINRDEVKLRTIALRYIIQDHYLDAEHTLRISPPDSHHIQKQKDGIYQLARLIALDSHKSLLHQGPKDMASDIQRKYWIKSITSLTRSVRSGCTTCKRKHGSPYTYPFATALPEVRTQACRPFQHIGLDYFGPIGYKTDTGSTGKLWAMLTTCLVTRAVHLEVVPDNTTSSFLLAMRRFIGRRGTPKTILSDNAPAFTLGYSMINADIRTMVNSSQTLTSYLASKDIEVKQITPFAPWQGGVYERIVGITKTMFYKIIGRLHCPSLKSKHYS
uniref:Integrase catalytic domain-containing protein n=1 Tax=Caenorhabditis japonica TaxID=281687 RepID=A0A8R1I4K3_CAEJA